jgi:hypothetical protein
MHNIFTLEDFKEGIRMLMERGATELAQIPDGSRLIGDPIWVTVDRDGKISQDTVRSLIESRLPSDKAPGVNAYSLDKTQQFPCSGYSANVREVQFYQAPASAFVRPCVDPLDCFTMHPYCT